MWRRLATWTVLLALLIVLLPATSGSTGPSQVVVVRVSAQDFQHLGSIAAQRVVEYSSFVPLDLLPEQLAALDAAGVSYQRDVDATFVTLSGTRIDTRAGLPTQAKSPQATIQAVPGTPELYVVQLAGPTKDAWLTELKKNKVKVVQYVPQYAYLVQMDPKSEGVVAKLPFVRWVGLYQPSYRVAPAVSQKTGLISNISVQIVDDGNADNTIAQIVAMGGNRVQDYSVKLADDSAVKTAIFSVDASIVPGIAALKNVQWVGYSSPKPGFDDEVSSQINAGNYTAGVPYTGYSGWLASKGYNGTGVRIADVDTGLDTNANANTTGHLDIRGRVAAFVDYTGGASVTDTDGHGTHTAGIIAGNGALGTTDASGFLYGLGVAPGAQIVAQNGLMSGVWPPVGGWGTFTRDGVLNGAVGSNNSWYTGASGPQGYSSAARDHDVLVRDADQASPGLQPFSIVFSAGNSGPGASTLSEPHEAKNIITVGATENYRPSNPLGAGCGASANIDGVVSFSSRGPTLDGRLKPDISAPGSDVASLRSSTGSYSGCGQVVAGASSYVYMSGTSMSSPQVAGGVALVTQWWRATHGGTNPSPAMTKGVLINSAVDVGTPNIPNNNEGWGRMNLTEAISPTLPTFYKDQTTTFLSSGQSWGLAVSPVDPTKPMKATLVWTDAPGIAGGNAWVNDLDLTLAQGSTIYRGNNFSNGFSVAGGSADFKNNVEGVYVQSPSGVYQVHITAANIAGDAIPGNGLPLDQDFALIIWNAQEVSDFILAANPSSANVCLGAFFQSEIGVAASGGFTGTVDLAVANPMPGAVADLAPMTGTVPFSSTLTVNTTGATTPGIYVFDVSGASGSTVHTTTVTLNTFGGSAPAPAQSSPLLSATNVSVLTQFGWSAVSGAQSYHLQVATAPGFLPVVADVPGLTSLAYRLPFSLNPNTTYWWRVGSTNPCGETFSGAWTFTTSPTVFWDDFDPVRQAWTTSAGQGVDNWGLSTAHSHSPTHSYRSTDPGSLKDDYLVSPAVAVGGPGAALTFWHTYALEMSYDGAVIEISTNGGASWTDLGPQIVRGGYDTTIDTGYSSPIGGRMAWSGGTAGPMTEVAIDLSSFAGQTVKLRFRLASDTSVGADGWYIDDINVTAPSSGPTSTSTVTPTPGGPTSTPTDTATPTSTPVPGAPTSTPTETPAPTGCYYLLEDNFEFGLSNWVADYPWDVTTESYVSYSHSATDSPGGEYADNTDASVVSRSLNTSGLSGPAILSFWARYDLEGGYDYVYLEVSTDSGNSWSRVTEFNGEGMLNWVQHQYDLTSYDVLEWLDFRFRFRLVTDSSVTYDGFYVDDVKLSVCASGATPTATQTGVIMDTPTPTVSPTVTQTPTVTQSPTVTTSPTVTASPTPCVTGSGTFKTDFDNANNAGTYGVPDGDMDVYLFRGDAGTPIEFYIDVCLAPNTPISNAQLVMTVYDVDYDYASGCPERDAVYIWNPGMGAYGPGSFGLFLGYLQGQNGTWTTSIFNLPPSAVVNGPNLVTVDIDTQCGSSWAVTVDWGQITVNQAGQGQANIRYLNTDKAVYEPFEQVLVTTEVDTNLASQQVRLESNLIDTSGTVRTSQSVIYTTLDGSNDPQVLNLALPASPPLGTWEARSVVFDTASGLIQDTKSVSFAVSLATATPTVTSTPTATPRPVDTATPTQTTIVQATATLTATGTSNATSSPQSTASSTRTPTITATPTPILPTRTATATPRPLPPGMRDLMVTNQRDTWFSVSWRTDQPVTGMVRYGTNPAAQSLDQVAQDDRGPGYAGETHYVRVGPLLPNTTYYLEVVSDGVVFNNGGSYYQVRTGPTLVQPEQDQAFGQVFQAYGGPAGGAIVVVTIEDADGQGSPGASAPLSDLADASTGFWDVNLGDARVAPDVNEYFRYSQCGDRLHIFVLSQGGYSAHYYVDTCNSAPVAGIYAFPEQTARVPIDAGWNLIALPLEPYFLPGYNVQSLAAEINGQGGGVSETYWWEFGGWAGGNVAGNHTPVDLGKGYFLKSGVPSTWTMLGRMIHEGVEVDFSSGWSLIGVPFNYFPNVSNLASYLGMIGAGPLEVDRWKFGGWQGYVVGYPFNDFPMETWRGYFVKVENGMVWVIPWT